MTHEMTRWTVRDTMESEDGGSGWGTEDYGPFASESAANDFARRLASEGYHSRDGSVRLVNVLSDGSGRLEDRCLFAWRSDDDDQSTRHTSGPSDREKAKFLLPSDD